MKTKAEILDLVEREDVEPWYGRCDRNTFTGTLEEREFSNHLLPEENFEKEYQIKFFV